jgi:adenosylhomocysteinase
MSNSFTNQTLAQIDLWQNNYEIGSTPCPNPWTRKWPGCTWIKLGAKLTKLSQEQADYIGVPVEGPFKPEHYRY